MTEEEEEKLIENIASLVVNKGLEVPAIMFFEVARPVSFVASQLAILR